MKKIAFLLPDVEPYNSFYGGACARWVGNILPLIATENISVLARGHDKKYIYDNNLISQFASSLIARFKKYIPLNNGGYDGFLWCLSWIMEIKKHDVIIIENRSHYVPYLRRLGYKGEIILHMHNDKLSNLDLPYLNLLNEQLNQVMVCSYSIIKELKLKHEGLYNKSTVVYNGVNQREFKNKGLPKIPQSVLFVGRIEENKGIHVLIEAINNLKEIFPEIILSIAGATKAGGDAYKSEYEKKIYEFIDKNNLQDHVNFLGYLDHDKELPIVYNQHEVFCLTSVYTEAFPLVVIESLFCETSVVASDIGGVSEAFKEGSKGLIEPGNAHQLAEAIRQTLKKENSAINIESFQFAKTNFTWDKVSVDFVEYLKNTNVI